MNKYVAYYRVSTARQGQSGLGLDAQRRTVREYLLNRGWPPIEEFTEVESGRKDSRPELAKAFRACRLHGATLVIAKLDRLARNASFLLSLKAAGIDFEAVDLPDANRLTVGIIAMVAEAEAEAISQRTKVALGEAKLRGVKLGNPRNLSNQALGTTKSAIVRSAQANRYAYDVGSLIDEIRILGITTLAAIAHELTCRGISTPRGATTWGPMQVMRVERRAADVRGRKSR
jgi:DNA invertase Pin-like site-specific DNA recombinase